MNTLMSCQKGHQQIVKYFLLEPGVEIYQLDGCDGGQPALYYAVKNGDLEMINILFEYGAKSTSFRCFK